MMLNIVRLSRSFGMQDFRKLRVWQANRELTKAIYRITASFPETERYGLTAQIRSAVTSIGANIAEGCGRGSRKDVTRFFQNSFASAVELLHHLITALDLAFISDDQFNELEGSLNSVRRMLAALIARIRSQ